MRVYCAPTQKDLERQFTGMIDKRLNNPTFLAGKTAYWLEVPSDAIEHCAPDIAADWLDGWTEARTEHMHLRASAAGHRRGFLSVDRAVVL